MKRSGKTSWRWLLALIVGLARGAGVAFAHPSLVRSEPPANAVVEAAPEQVTVWFDEALEPDYGTLSVYDAQGQRVDSVNTRYDPSPEPSLTVGLPDLPRGSYVVVWRVISVGDAHAVGGAFAFGVGVSPDVAAAAAAGAQANPEPDLTTHLIRYLGLLAQAVLLGAVVFRWLAWYPTLAETSADAVRAVAREEYRTLTLLADILRAMFVISLLGALYVQARATGVLFWQLFATRWGIIWIVRTAAAIVAVGTMERLLLADTPRWAWLGLGLSMVLLVTTTLTSHSSAKPGLVGPLADSAHLLAGSVWAGGLVMLTLGLISLRVLEPESRTRMATEVVARFSGLASASVGLLVASGLVLSSRQVASWPGLLLTAYGQTLLVKLLVVCAAFGFGMYNSLRLRHTVSVGMEAAVVAGVIFAAAFLTDLPPANTALANPGADQAGLALNTQAVGLTLTGQVRPARPGNNVFEWQIVNAAGAPERDLQIEVLFQPVGGGALVSSLTLAEAEAGVYSATGSPFQREGLWQLLLTLSRPEGDPILTTFDVSVGPDGVVRLASDPLPALVRAVVWLERYGQVMLAGLVLALTAGWGWVIWQTRPGVGRSPVGWLAVGLLIAALIWFMLALSTQH